MSKSKLVESVKELLSGICCNKRLVNPETLEQVIFLAVEIAREGREGKPKSEVSKTVGALVARRAKEKGISSVVFDRGGHAYHGRVKTLADAAREGGLVF